VRELNVRKFGIHLSIAAVVILFTELKLTPQKPLQRAYQREAQAVQYWRRKRYPARVSQVKKEKAEMSFWDESGFRADAVQGKTWTEHGNTSGVSWPGQS